MVGLPDVRGRIEILKHHMGEVQFDVDVDPSIIARGCPGMSGADLQNLVNQVSRLLNHIATCLYGRTGCCEGFERRDEPRSAEALRMGERSALSSTAHVQADLR